MKGPSYESTRRFWFFDRKPTPESVGINAFEDQYEVIEKA
jgi:hypothetical protein